MVAKAKLIEIKWDASQQQAETVPGGKEVEVQFNPESLRLSYQNKVEGGDQPGGSSAQYVGSGKSTMSIELLFDTTENGSDVREKTRDVAFFIGAKQEAGTDNKRTPPGIRVEWGSFIFQGVVESMQETLDYFSAEGVPLRATVSLSMTRQDIEFLFGKPGSPAGGAGGGVPGSEPATSPLEPARPGDSLQELAGRSGKSQDWRAIAEANDIDDPLRLEAGLLIDINIST